MIYLLSFLVVSLALCVLLVFNVFALRVLFSGLAFYVILQCWISADLYFYLRRQARAYILKPYNHWLIYLGLILLLGALPLWGTKVYLNQVVFGTHSVQGDENFPALREGDTLLYERTSAENKNYTRGEIVVAQLRDGSLSLLRIIGAPRDRIRVRPGGRVFVNQVPLKRQPLGRIQWKKPLEPPLPSSALVGYLETVSQRSYEAFYSTDVRLLGDYEEELSEGHYFLMADNRTAERSIDSRHLGPFHQESLMGRALYVLTSAHPETQDWRWDRVGLLVD
jgi:signal peptidase I